MAKQRTAFFADGDTSVETEQFVYDIIQIINNHNGKLISVTPQKENLETIFLEVVKGESENE